jgi:hypothetical protein
VASLLGLLGVKFLRSRKVSSYSCFQLCVVVFALLSCLCLIFDCVIFGVLGSHGILVL